VDALAAQAPVWTPGEAQGYHAVTFGWLVGEVIRRIGGKSVGAFLRDEVTDPLNVDFLIGFGPEEDHRVADMLKPVQTASTWPSSNPVAGAADPNSIPFRAFSIAPPGHGAHVNSRQYRAAEVPAANGHGNARALARVYGALASGGEVDGVNLLSPGAIELARAEQVFEPDLVLTTRPRTRRSLGFMLPVPDQGDVRGPQAFGHAGMGGSLGYADPETHIGFGYTMNQMWSGGDDPDPRAQGLAAAVNESLDR
ncbi:MAG: serine hydrolase, partial [Chloroflexi bacterium]|nr:serine hydrolase [Chloroflexota bacterium]